MKNGDPAAILQGNRSPSGDGIVLAPMPIPRLRLPLIAAAALAAFAAGAQDNVRLPDLGSSANALISPREADEYGAMMLRQMLQERV